MADYRLAATISVAAYNVVQNLLVPTGAYVPANLTASLGLVALARRQGCTWEDLGLDTAHAGGGLRMGMAGAVVAATLAVAAGLHPVGRRYLLDSRAAGQRGRDIAYRTLIRFPLGTALFEELAFRGVFYGLWRHGGASTSGAAYASAAAFGLWHLIPAGQALEGNPLAVRLASTRARAGVVVAGAMLTGLAGLGLTWMRQRSGSVIAPWLTHAAVNSAGYLAGVAAWRARRARIADVGKRSRPISGRGAHDGS